jgi:hypothetical protein
MLNLITFEIKSKEKAVSESNREVCTSQPEDEGLASVKNR